MDSQPTVVRNHYEVLGLPTNAPTRTVLAAKDFEMQRVYETMDYDEPTVQGQAALQAQLDRIQDAFDVLSDPPSRAHYDIWLGVSDYFALPSPARSYVEPPARPAAATASAASHAQHAWPLLRANNVLPDPRDVFDIYPDVWIAIRDGRYRSDGTRWSAPRPSPDSPRYRPDPSRRLVGRRAPRGVDRYVPSEGGRRSPVYEARG